MRALRGVRVWSYGLWGTDLAYAATLSGRDVHPERQRGQPYPPTGVLTERVVVPGRDVDQAALYRQKEYRRGICLRAPYAMSGTDRPYAATRCSRRSPGHLHYRPARVLCDTQD
eukprot:2246115-Rhodomonas_salina.1